MKQEMFECFDIFKNENVLIMQPLHYFQSEFLNDCFVVHHKLLWKTKKTTRNDINDFPK